MLKRAFFALFGLVYSAQAFSAVVDFVPRGRVRLVSQIRVKFDKSMTEWTKSHKYGEIPFTSNCTGDSWNEWTDDRNLIVHLSKPKTAGMKCQYVSTTDNKSFEFIVEGPNILELTPQSSIDSDQVFAAVFDGPFSKAKVLSLSYFVTEGLGDRIGIVEANEQEKQAAIEHITKNEYAFPGMKRDGKNVSFDLPILYFKAKRSFAYSANVSFVLPKESAEAAAAPLTDQVLKFKTMDDFKVSFNCDRESADKPCIPLSGMDLNFTTEVFAKELKSIYLETSSGKRFYSNAREQDDRSGITNVRFSGPFEESTSFKLVIPSGLKDINGRRLVNENMFPLKVSTSGYPSLLKFAASFGLYEGADPVVPVTIRNVLDAKNRVISGYTKNLSSLSNLAVLKQIQEWTRVSYGETSLLPAGHDFTKVEYKRGENDEQTEVLGLPLSGVGAHLLELKSDQLGLRLLEKETPFYVRTVALVSNMAVHIKSTETDVMVWVTNLNSTAPVDGAELEILSCGGESYGRAKTNVKGLAFIKPLKKLDYNNLKYCAEGGKFTNGFVLLARKGNDIAMASSTWDEGISRWRFGVPMPYGEKEFAAHAVLDRNLIRPNEVLHMKVFARVLGGKGLRFARVEELPKEMIFEHYFSGEQIKTPIKWNVSTGSFTNELLITEKMKLGRWNISLKGKKESYLAGSFDVQQYQIPMVEVKILATTDPLVGATKIPYQVNAQYLSGGAADSLYMTETWSVSEYFRNFSQKGRESYTVLNGRVEEGLKKNNYDYSEGEGEAEAQSAQKFKQNIRKFALNKTGGIANTIEGVPARAEPQVVNLNLQYRDPNGELQSKGRSFVVYGADKLLGVKIEREGSVSRAIVAKALVTDLTEKAFEGAKVKFTMFEKLMFSHRKRLVGGFYSYESFVEVKKTDISCEAKTDARGEASCKLKPERSGHYYIEAETEDARGNRVYANTYTFFGEKREAYWDDSEDSDRMTLNLDKERYAPDEVAKIEAKIPFAKGHYLVTVEREGVIQAEVYELKQAAPEIQLPIKKEYAPNVFVSVFAIRGRVSEYKPTALIDLGKPTYRMGVAEVKVAMTQNRLNVKVQTDAKTYRVRDVAKAKINVTDYQNKPVKGQVILAAVDEGLLYLAPNTTWNLVENMVRIRGLSVDTSTSLTEVVGRRHYGKKAIANGGDGRGSQLREQMDSLLLWKSEVNLDDKGEAVVDVPLNDSLSAFRIVAIATNGADQFGTASTSIRTTQDVMIFSGLPTFTRQGDSLMANVTVRNSSNRNIDGQMLASWNGVPLEIKKTQLAAERSNVFEWKVNASEIGTSKFIAEFRSASGKREDGLAKDVSVLNPAPLRAQANVLYKLDSLRSWPLPWRPDLKADSGQVDVKLSSDLNVNKAQMKEFWDEYPYSCLEQQISRAASLNDEKLWTKINRNLSAYIAKSGLFKFFPEAQSNSSGSVALTSYYVLMAKARNFEVAQEEKIKETLKSYIQGRIVETYKLDEATKLQMKITAAEALVKLGALQANERVQYMPELNKMPLASLFSLREIHVGIPSSANYLALIDQQIKSRMITSGSDAGFSEDMNSWMTLSNSQVQLARAILWPALSVDDLGRLLTATQKKVGNYMWQSTIGNAWMSVALSEAKEKLSSKVDGATEVSFGSAKTSKKWTSKEIEINALSVPLNAGLMQIYHRGSGAPWMTAQFKARKDLQSEVSQGLQFVASSKSLKEKSFVTNTDDESVLEFSLNSSQDLNWVAVEIPMPPGSMIVDIESSAWIEFQERRYESLKLYLGFLAKGETKFKISVRTNQKGQFGVPGLRAEAMYSPQYQAETSMIKWSVQ